MLKETGVLASLDVPVASACSIRCACYSIRCSIRCASGRWIDVDCVVDFVELVALLKGRTVLVLGLAEVARSVDAPHTRVAIVTHGWHVPPVTHVWHLSRGSSSRKVDGEAR